ncbi:unnamed protein product [Lactuca saligna]|uniref:Uncharacterized protein n=1 Tax=Lactuca saligna TaxID=75948 RepID=A0AA36EES9_LACSI|nr:unnamed protein product [Lactuca saligna]
MCEKISKEASGGRTLQYMNRLLIHQKEVEHLHIQAHNKISLSGHIGVDLNNDNDDIEEIHPHSRPLRKDKAKAQGKGKGKGKATSSNSLVETERSNGAIEYNFGETYG